MKTTKKLAALFLALVMALSCMAMTAAAYGEDEHVHDGTCCAETVQPRTPGAVCPNCMCGMQKSHTGADGNGRYTEFWCINPDCNNHGYEKIYW